MVLLLKNYKTWLTVAAFFFAILVTGPLGNRIWDWPNAWPLAAVGMVLALLTAGWRWRAARSKENRRRLLDEQCRREELRQQFAICKRVEDLQPEDLGFQPLWPNQEGNPRLRPFYPTYVLRSIVPVDQVAAVRPTSIFTEADLQVRLDSAQGFVLLGQPTAGKSRTLFEIVWNLHDWTVVSPKKDAPAPRRETFEELFANQRVLLLLEDLNDFADATVDLVAFSGANGLGRAKMWAVAATCRDGPELSAVKEAHGRSLRRFYDEIQLKLALVPQSADEKADLALSAGKRWWDAGRADDYPTPGTIVMEEALVFMRGRYERLPPERRDALRALKLLTEAGVLPLRHDRIKTVVERVFRRPLPQPGDCLDKLADDAFLRQPGSQDPVFPERAYLQDRVVCYAADRQPPDDFPELLTALQAGEDAEGVAMVGITYAAVQGNHALALDAFDVALRVSSANPSILVNRGASLNALGRHAEALADFDAALQHDPYPFESRRGAGWPWPSRGGFGSGGRRARKRIGRPGDALEPGERFDSPRASGGGLVSR